jgi:pyrimidine-specific ribonucleoside hydrolase
MKKLNCVYHLETNDPDDYMTLCLLTTHPKVNLKAITIDPGAPEQVAIVKYVLNQTKRTDVRVGVPDNRKYTFPNRKDPVVSNFHYKIIPQLRPDYSAELCDKVLHETFNNYPDTIILTGAAVTNIANFLKKYPDVIVKKWVAQGGFAGTNIVAKENELAKFAGQEVCRTFNSSRTRAVLGRRA